ncbi:MAG: class II aldolase/adducin family protein [Clostridiales bacterium]|nr:class II aldolase/adducin family protein [Clostridiales bacterium]MBS5878126.1 class II aldolase/adducin family protein [Clostridiales bacterium]MDU0939407.1 class II aldolase/adducin family protein [Clostridiales bacterium]MDU1042391.1 class II aldolase/adducin family protein [Clostridiales bacterium]MDU3490148.1 class II aldolase/adducin family protein [Clostridiales bacterium]
MTKDELRAEVVHYFKKQYDLGMLNTFEGNLSVRVKGSNTILITPSQQEKDKITPEMILEVDMDGNLLDKTDLEPSSELGMHLEVYKLRSDLQSVLHNHSTFATAFALVGRPLANDMAESFMFYGGDIPVAPYGRPGTADVYKDFKKFFVDRDRDALLLANHGLVTAGYTVGDAFSKAEAIEKLAKITIMSEILGPDNPLSAIEKQKLLDIYKERKNVIAKKHEN